MVAFVWLCSNNFYRENFFRIFMEEVEENGDDESFLFSWVDGRKREKYLGILFRKSLF